MLIARAMAEKGNTPYKLLGVFLAYLMERHGKKVASINMQLRCCSVDLRLTVERHREAAGK
jgi:hypothetical protein